MSKLQATLIGSTAVALWGALALFTTWTGDVPPFQLVAMTFALAFLLACGKWALCRENPFTFLNHRPVVFLFGVGGLFGYHFFYFVALKNAPPVDASLIAYLWPLLIVLFSALLPGETLRWYHLVGCLVGLAGCVVLVTRGGEISFDARYTLGYAAAGVCALTWSSYSVLSRRLSTVPTDTVGWFCGGVAVAALAAHLVMEQWVWPQGFAEWAAIVGLGLGPVGAAFFTWDIGMKRGDIRVLGATSYLAPLISVLLLIAFGAGTLTWTITVACLAIVGGALIAAKDMILPGKQKASLVSGRTGKGD